VSRAGATGLGLNGLSVPEFLAGLEVESRKGAKGLGEDLCGRLAPSAGNRFALDGGGIGSVSSACSRLSPERTLARGVS
jgi:hypothetical protein